MNIPYHPLLVHFPIGFVFAALILLENGNELMRTKCLPEEPKNNDFNGLGSSNIHLDDFLYLIQIIAFGSV